MKKITLIASVLLLSACNGVESNAKNVIRERLKDPDSAQFRNIRASSFLGKPAACGEVNAKNGFGAYVGFKHFVYIEEPYQDAFYVPIDYSVVDEERYRKAYATVCMGMSEEEYKKARQGLRDLEQRIASIEKELSDLDIALAYPLEKEYSEISKLEDKKNNLLKELSDLNIKKTIDYLEINPFENKD